MSFEIYSGKVEGLEVAEQETFLKFQKSVLEVGALP
jgi:hypothetical protein